MRIHKTCCAMAAILAAGSGALSAAESGDAAANGKRLYVTVGCFECHGREGQGGAFNGPAPALAGFLSGKTALDLIAAVRRGPNDMPVYTEKVLSNQDLNDILAYIRSLPGPSDPQNYAQLNR